MVSKSGRWVAAGMMFAVVAGVLVTFVLPIGPASPPDFTGQGFTSVHVEMRGIVEHTPAVSVSSEDSALIEELAGLLRTGRPVVVCQCATLGTLGFRRPDGTSERVFLVPAHDDGSVEYRVMGRGRYRVDREAFLRAVSTLGVPVTRWYQSPMADG